MPIDPSNVRMYVCGPTVYDRAHIGNARPVVVFDVLFRLLRHVYGEGHVTYVRNVTDVDDKINARAAAEKRPIRELTDETLAAYHADMDALGALPPDPRAARHRVHPADGGDDRDADRPRPRLRGRGPRPLRRRELPRLRPLRPPLARRDAGRRPRRGRALQARPDGLRALEALDRRRARLALALGPRPPRLAHRVLGDVRGAARRLLRHPRRRHRPRLPAPRERDRPVALRPPGGRVRALLAAQRLPERRRREDVEVARQLLHRARPPRPGHPGRGDPLRAAVDALPPADGLDRGEGARRRRTHSGEAGATLDRVASS